MKTKIVFLFLFILIAFTSPVYSDSYFNYNSFGGTWYDANKTPANTDDDAMCWAAAASDALMWTGWNAGFSNADAIFAEFQNQWTNSGQSVDNAWSWWFNGTYTAWPSSAVAVPGSGDFYPSYPFTTYYQVTNNTSTALSDIDIFLHSGDGVVLTIANPWGYAHAVTVWGYEYDAQGNYIGIYITDSDDNISDNPQATLRYYDVAYNTSDMRWYLQNFQLATTPSWGNVFSISYMEALGPKPIPEPATMLLLGSGLLGLLGLRRKFKK